MGYQSGPSNHDLSELLSEWIGKIAQFLMWAGGVIILAGAGFLFYYVFTAGQMTPALEQQAFGNISTIQGVLIVGLVAFAVGSSVVMWGEQLLVPIQLILAAVLFAAPNYLPMIGGPSTPSKVASKALDSLHDCGTIFGALAICVLIADIFVRVRERAEKGSKADQMKYGKGIKQEDDRQNVMLGKCWQLPYCRKFVRERCPIFHSKRTCWKEQVGCMCEEQVIRDAMENKVIPKDAVLAAKMIPRNNKLTIAQKHERCKTCVIYNEHQRQKYKASLPVMVGGFILVYALCHGVLVGIASNLVYGATRAASGLTLQQAAEKTGATNVFFSEFLLAAIFLVLLSYSLKALEFAIFKLKI